MWPMGWTAWCVGKETFPHSRECKLYFQHELHLHRQHIKLNYILLYLYSWYWQAFRWIRNLTLEFTTMFKKKIDRFYKKIYIERAPLCFFFFDWCRHLYLRSLFIISLFLKVITVVGLQKMCAFLCIHMKQSKNGTQLLKQLLWHA